MEKSYKEYLHNVTTFVFDVDGVFTDGSVLVTEQGELLRKMNVKDGYALKTAIQKGFNVCIISGGTSEGVRVRFKSLGVKDIYLGAHLKLEPINEYLAAHKIDVKNVLYMGDDMPDVPPMQLVGMPTCPQDAIPEIKAVSKYISQKNGGNGCVRDVIEQVLKAQGKWNDNYSAKND